MFKIKRILFICIFIVLIIIGGCEFFSSPPPPAEDEEEYEEEQSGNSFKVNGTTYSLDFGMLEYYGEDEIYNSWDIDITLFSSYTEDTGIYLDLNSPYSSLASGTYNWSNSGRVAYSIVDGGVGTPVNEYRATAGSVSVNVTGTIYSINFTLILSNGGTSTGSYTGTLEYYDDEPGGGVPVSPSGLFATALSSSSIHISWSDNSSNESGFRIQRSTSSSYGFTEISSVSANVEEYTDTGLSAGTTYYYRVSAYNASGESSYTSDSAATYSSGSTPDSPTGLYASAESSTSIYMYWYDNSDDETGFRIERSTSSSYGFSEIDTVGANVEEYTDYNLDPETTYYYRVYAYNTYGDSWYTSDSATTESGGGGALFEENFDTYFLSRWFVKDNFLSHYNNDVFWSAPGALSSYGCFRLDGGYLYSITDGEYTYTTVDSDGIQPTYVQVYIKASYDDYNGGNFVVVGDGISLWSFFDSYGRIYIINNGSENYVRTYSPGSWYRLEFKNINYSTKRYDFYVNSVLYESSVSFANTSSTKAQQIWIWNDESASDFWYDEILIE